MWWLIFGLVFCLLCTIGMTTTELSGDLLKGFMTLCICLLIAFVLWVNK